MGWSGPGDPLEGLRRPAGDAGAARAQAALLGRVAGALTGSAGRVESAAGSVDRAWVGAAGGAAGRVASAQAAAARARVPVVERAASALVVCAGEWESAQDRFDVAVRLAASAVSEEADHRGRVTSSVWAAAGAAVVDDGWRSPDRARARAMAQEAVDDAEVASRRCAAALSAALPELGPPPPPPVAVAAPAPAEKAWWDIGDDLNDQVADLWQGVQDVGDFVVDNGPELIDLAADTALMAIGAAAMVAGAAGAGGGTLVAATGVGAPVGAPVAAASVGLIVLGAGTATVGAVKFGEDLQTLLNQANSSSGGGTSPSQPPAASRTPSRPVRAPDPDAVPTGQRARPGKNDKDPVNIRSIELENKTADDLARAGYDVEQRPAPKPNGKKPDYRINGEYADCVSPRPETPARSVVSRMREKVAKSQAERIVVNLDDSRLTNAQVRDALDREPIDNLIEVIVVRNGSPTHIYP